MNYKLKELIIKCGNNFLSLKRNTEPPHTWTAFGGFPEKGISLVEEMNIKGIGDTPEKAVEDLIDKLK